MSLTQWPMSLPMFMHGVMWWAWLGTTVNEAEPRKRQRGGCMRGVANASGIGDAVEPAGTSRITDH
eukprot:scaffold2621_cov124-Isochrysis_galbana.AAC.4